MKNNDIILIIEQILNNKTKIFEKVFLDTIDTCLFLGVSKSTLYKKYYNKEIPYFKPDDSKKITIIEMLLLNTLPKTKCSQSRSLKKKPKIFLKPKK
ncbi:hypothetical protein [Apibacter adventoris]|uniref:DNA-binding protein n=1 Tax=Apibacter adventoris TaxID=1679466 RepID=A0A2S8A7I6_9FLAO|nr:hypothetical protein [Apibacter adventoris]PQL90537.1 hypothetical protein C4S77_11680 [Apibacter adventoris]